MVTRIIRLAAISVVGFICVSGPMVVVAQERAEVRDAHSDSLTDKLYGDASLNVWQERFGDVKPSSAYAAELVPGMLEIVEDRAAPSVLRERAAITLGRIGKPAVDAVPVLGGILIDPNEPLLNRVWACRSLGYFGKYASPASDQLVTFLFDETVPFEHRPVPVEALGRIGTAHPNVVPALLRLFEFSLDDDDQLSSGDVARLRELAIEAFIMMGPDSDVATPLLMRAARNSSETETIRRKSLVAIGEIGPNAAVAIPVLLESLEFDPSEAVRDEAARSLAKLGDQGFFMLERYLEHPDAAVRSRIASACGIAKVIPDNVVDALRRSLSDPKEEVQIASAESLGKVAAVREETMRTAVTLLESDQRQIRMRAMRLILDNQPLRQEEVAALTKLSRHDDSTVARIAKLIVKKNGAEQNK